MRLVIQRVSDASVKVEEKIVGRIEKGYMVLVGIKESDTEKEVEYLAKKLINLRIFEDENGKMNLSIQDIGGELLLISQFTLYADCSSGNRPSFTAAARPEKAQKLYECFCEKCSEKIHVERGIFGANMQVSLTNDGPVTINLEK